MEVEHPKEHNYGKGNKDIRNSLEIGDVERIRHKEILFNPSRFFKPGRKVPISKLIASVCTNCGTSYIHRIYKPSQSAPCCYKCLSIGTIQSNSDQNIRAIYIRVLNFFDKFLNVKFTPDLFSSHFSNHKVLTQDSILNILPVVVVDYNQMNSNTFTKMSTHHQLGRCGCRVAIFTSTKVEIERWVKRIVLSRGLSYETFGAILAHELMHAYLWLQRIGGMSMDVEEVLCNMASSLYLKNEYQRLCYEFLTKGPTRKDIYRTRLQICQYRIYCAEMSQNETSKTKKCIQRFFNHVHESWPQLLALLSNRF